MLFAGSDVNSDLFSAIIFNASASITRGRVVFDSTVLNSDFKLWFTLSPGPIPMRFILFEVINAVILSVGINMSSGYKNWGVSFAMVTSPHPVLSAANPDNSAAPHIPGLPAISRAWPKVPL